VISAQGATLGPTAYKVFDERGGSIGRLDNNDWTLPDPDKFVSSRHAVLKFKAGAFYLEDTSTNGTFINAREQPVSKSEPTLMRDGDRIFIGDYEILVQIIDYGAAAPELMAVPATAGTQSPPRAVPQPTLPLPRLSMPHSGLATEMGLQTGDPLAVIVGRAGGHAAFDDPAVFDGEAPVPVPTAAAAPGPGALPEPFSFESAIPLDWQLTGSRTLRPATPALVSVLPAIGPPPSAITPMASTLGAAPTASAASGGGAPEVLAGLGLDPTRVDPSIYQQLAGIIRIVVQGMLGVLQARAEVKNNFRMSMTSIRPVENTPLKFSLNADDALHNLFVKRNPGYLGPPEAFYEGFQDIAFHQMAMLAGIRAAYDSMLGKFHPARLEELYTRKLRRTSVLNLGNRLKFWEMYREQFEDLEKDHEANFQLLFGEEFARAYNEQLQKLAAAARLQHR
jgi:type VI secretion system protein ImpI/type VI secretion system protein